MNLPRRISVKTRRRDDACPALGVVGRAGFMGVFYFVSALVAVTAAPPAREPVAEALPLLTTTRQVRALTPEDAARSYPVRVTGVVTLCSAGPGLVVHDDTDGIYVRTQSIPRGLKSGDKIELRGVTGPGKFAPEILAGSFDILGTAPLPQAIHATIDQLASGRLDSQWVEVEGVIRAVEVPVRRTGALLLLGMTGREINVDVLDCTADELRPLVDAEVRLRGAVSGAFNERRQLVLPRLLVDISAGFTVLKPAPSDPFARPVLSISRLMQFDPDQSVGHRVRVRATVTHLQPGQALYLRDGSHALRVQTRDSTVASVGDLVDVLGFPGIEDQSAVLEEAVFRRIGPKEIPRPVATTPSVILKGAHDAELVVLDAELLELVRRPNDWGLLLRADNTNFTASLADPLKPGTSPAQRDERTADRVGLPSSVQRGSRLQLTGICLLRGRAGTGGASFPESFALLIRSPSDIVVVKPAPWWTPGRLAAVLAVTGLAVSLSIIWVVVLRQRVREQAAALASKARREAVLEERHRIAMDIHDVLAQGFTAISCQLELVRAKVYAAPEQAAGHLEQARKLVRSSLAGARRSIRDLHTPALAGSDLPTAVGEIGRQLTEGTGVRFELEVKGAKPEFPADMENKLLHIAQEAVTNAVKHAHPSAITVELEFGSHFAVLRIRDDGVGCSPDAAGPGRRGDRGGFGLIGMQERARQLGGELSVTSEPGAGTTITAVIPVTELEPAAGP